MAASSLLQLTKAINSLEVEVAKAHQILQQAEALKEHLRSIPGMTEAQPSIDNKFLQNQLMNQLQDIMNKVHTIKPEKKNE